MIVRKRADRLTPQEKSSFVDALVKLKNENVSPSAGVNIGFYDQFVAVHLGARVRMRNGNNTFDGAHNGPAFLSWHREYLVRIERELQRVSGNPNLAIPYWDWSNKDLPGLIFSDDFLGGNGTGEQISYPWGGGRVVETGPMSFNENWVLDERIHISSALQWNSGIDLDQFTFGKKLLRSTGTIDGIPNIQRLEAHLDIADFGDFRASIETGPKLHNTMHAWVGGTMGGGSSPYDPVFLMNHAFIDYVWALWQSYGHWGADFYHKATEPETSHNRVNYGHKIDDRMWPWDQGESETHARLRQFMPDLSAETARTPRKVLDCRELGYTYTDWPRVKDILDRLIADWTAKFGMPPNLVSKHVVPAFSWDTPTDLASVTVFGQFQLIEADKTGNGRAFETNLVQALRQGVAGFDQMPLGGPHLTDGGRRFELAEISHWIDMGMPGDPADIPVG